MGAITLSDLNNYMKNYPSGTIVPENAHWDQVPLFKALRPSIDRSVFRGEHIEVLMETGIGGTFEGFSENQDIPHGAAPAYEKQLVPLKEVIANAELTLQTRNRAIGGDTAWGRAVDMAIQHMFRRFYYGLELACLGNGTGALARVVSASHVDDSPSTGLYTYTVTCDNTYADFGVENVQLLQPGMKIDIYNGSNAVASCTGLTVTGVSFGERANGAATSGTFTFVSDTDALLGTPDNYVVYLANSKSKLPMGLLGIVQDGVHYSGVAQLTTFQDQARADHAALRAKVYQATDFGPAGETPADGTPCSWALSTISDAIDEAEDTSGREIGALFVHSELAKAIDRLNRAANSVSVTVTTTEATTQPVVGARQARTFEKSSGRQVPIYVCRTLPRNVLYGLSLDCLGWHPETEFDFLRLYGEVWMPSKDDRKANFEAPYYGSYNISSTRCDGHFVMQDMSTAPAT